MDLLAVVILSLSKDAGRLDITRYIEYYRVMLTYDVLAALWDSPATDMEVARTVEERLGAPFTRNMVDQHLRLLRTTGHVSTKNVDGAPAYVLTATGAALLSNLASKIDGDQTEI